MPPPSKTFPDGDYPAELVGVDTFSNAHGARIGFRWLIISTNVEVMQSAAVSASLTSKLAEITRSIADRELKACELTEQALSRLLGTRCHVHVQQNANRAGKTYMEVTKVRPLR